ncbi:MAG: STAS/SEC14 domain-containing protein [Pseudomonadota bacterium]
MLKITKPSPNRVDLELNGPLDSESMASGLDELIEKSEDVKHGRMLYTITDFSMPSFGAIGVEMQRLPKLFGLLGKFDRCAVICDESWLRTAAEIEGRLFPGIDIKSFQTNELEEAEKWLAEDEIT